VVVVVVFIKIHSNDWEKNVPKSKPILSNSLIGGALPTRKLCCTINIMVEE